MQAKRKSAEEKDEELSQLEEKRKKAGKYSDQFSEAEENRYQELRHERMDREYSYEKWGPLHKMKNWFSTRKGTGLSNKRMDIETRMNLEMMGMNSNADADADDAFDNEMEAPVPDDDDNEVYD